MNCYWVKMISAFVFFLFFYSSVYVFSIWIQVTKHNPISRMKGRKIIIVMPANSVTIKEAPVSATTEKKLCLRISWLPLSLPLVLKVNEMSSTTFESSPNTCTTKTILFIWNKRGRADVVFVSFNSRAQRV